MNKKTDIKNKEKNTQPIKNSSQKKPLEVKQSKKVDDKPAAAIKVGHQDTNATKLAEQSSEVSSINTGKVAAKTFLFTLAVLLCAAAYFVATAVVVLPKKAIKAFDYLGMEKASYVVYQRLYKRTQSNEDRYNVLQLAIKYQDFERVEQYSKEMIESFGFSRFSQDIDDATRAALGLEYAAFADNYKNYVVRNLVVALYKNDKIAEAKLLAIESVFSDANALSAYTFCLVTDEGLSKETKKNLLIDISQHLKLDKSDELGKLDALLDSDSFNPDMESEVFEKLVAYRQRIKIHEIKYYILDAMGEADSAEAEQDAVIYCQSSIQELLNKSK